MTGGCVQVCMPPSPRPSRCCSAPLLDCSMDCRRANNSLAAQPGVKVEVLGACARWARLSTVV